MAFTAAAALAFVAIQPETTGVAAADLFSKTITPKPSAHFAPAKRALDLSAEPR